jgi:hypothetical protein
VRVSSPVLRGPGGEIPPGYLPAPYGFSLVSYSIPKLIIFKKNNITYSIEDSNNRLTKSSHIIIYVAFSHNQYISCPVSLSDPFSEKSQMLIIP